MNQKHVYNINHNLEPDPSSISTKPCKRKPVKFFWQVGPRQHRDSGTHWPPTVFYMVRGEPLNRSETFYMGCYVSSYLSSYVGFSCLFQGGIPLNRSFSVLNRSEPFRGEAKTAKNHVRNHVRNQAKKTVLGRGWTGQVLSQCVTG